MNPVTQLQCVLESNQFAVTAEIGPPKGADPTSISQKASVLYGYADAYNITDNQTAVVRLSSIAGAIHVKKQKMEPIVQMACRDRNRIALQSDILGASSLGVHNMLFVTGDHQSKGNHPMAKGVFDIDSVHLIGIARQLRDEGVFQSQDEIRKGKPSIFIGAVENPFATPLDIRVDRLEKKIEAGAQFIQTQSVFNIDRFTRWMGEITDRGLDKQVHILAGITPIKSQRMLNRMRFHVPGVDIPDDIAYHLESAQDIQIAAKEISIDLIKRIKKIKGVHGIHLSAIFWENIIPEIITKSQIGPKYR